jgi:membrane fusion protein (multidrug efflux system)
VQAFVARVLVDDNQEVKAGDTLLVLDDRDLQLRLRQAEAELAAARAQGGGRREGGQAEAQLGTAEAQAARATSTVAVQEARLRQATADLERYRVLAAGRAVSEQRLDQAQREYDEALAEVEAARRSVSAARSQVSAASAGIRGAGAQIAAAAAAVATARVDVGYTVLLAPIDGIIARRRVEPGELVQPGQALMSVVPTTDLWVTANLKETQLADVNPGDEVTFAVDTYKGVEFRGTVASVSPATGARFALLPPDNATGNYTKVVQRVPVRIAVDGRQDPAHPLRPGLSADVKIRVR